MAFNTPKCKFFTQVGVVSGLAGASGSVDVFLPMSYADTHYFVSATPETAVPCIRLSLVVTGSNTFTIYWTTGTAYAPVFRWFTTGS